MTSVHCFFSVRLSPSFRHIAFQSHRSCLTIVTMKSEESSGEVQEPTLDVFKRMFRAVELVQERLDRACKALQEAEIPYAVVGGNAVAAWVATVDEGAVRNTRDVDLLFNEEDLSRATEVLEAAGFVRDQVLDTVIFLDGPQGKPSQGLHVLLAGRKVKAEYATAAPGVQQSIEINQKRVVELLPLVEMKLNSYRDKDKAHLRDLIQVGLIDSTWLERLPVALAPRLKELLDNPED